jgi:hypothetical protein
MRPAPESFVESRLSRFSQNPQAPLGPSTVITLSSDAMSILNQRYRPEIPKVEESNDPPLQLTFCRFESDGMLKRWFKVTADITYIAISHVWEKVSWRCIPGVPGEVLASQIKAEFIAQKLSALVGRNYFWMDILCVDQSDKAARIAVTQHIPTIFRSAKKVILIKDGSAFRDCCVRTIGDIPRWFNPNNEGRQQFFDHYSACHPQSVGLSEGVLTRLWPFQEIILSDRLQFVNCDGAIEVVDNAKDQTNQKAVSAVTHFITSLQNLSQSWAMFAVSPAAQYGFFRAFITNGSVSRTQSELPMQVPSIREICMHYNSVRRTTKPRDFILAIMPQYRFYTVPQNAREMTFGELFIDCSQSAERNGLQIGWSKSSYATYGSGEEPISGFAGLAPNTIPEPKCLGDLMKLFLVHRRLFETLNTPDTSFNSEMWFPLWGEGKYIMRWLVKVHAIIDQCDVLTALQLIRDSIRKSRTLWPLAFSAELRAIDTEPFTYDETTPSNNGQSIHGLNLEAQSAVKIIVAICVNCMVHDLQEILPWGLEQLLINFASRSYINTLLRLAAMISCGIGISAFEWCCQHLTPVLVKVQDHSFLALLPMRVMQDVGRWDFAFLRASQVFDTKRYLLCANSWGESVPGLFPPDVELNME